MDQDLNETNGRCGKYWGKVFFKKQKKIKKCTNELNYEFVILDKDVY